MLSSIQAVYVLLNAVYTSHVNEKYKGYHSNCCAMRAHSFCDYT